MSLVKMQTNIHPLCHVHRDPMVPSILVSKMGLPEFDPMVSEVYACQAPGCHFYYNNTSGYFEAEIGKTGRDRDMTVWRKCRRDGLPMYIADIQPDTGKRIWKCAQVDCDGSQEEP